MADDANYTIEGIGDVRLINFMSAQLQTGRTMEWRFSPVEVIGAGLAFGVPSTGVIPARIPRIWCGGEVFDELAGHQDPLERRRELAALLLDRAAKAVRGVPERVGEAAE